jgi:hypothetical protein
VRFYNIWMRNLFDIQVSLTGIVNFLNMPVKLNATIHETSTSLMKLLVQQSRLRCGMLMFRVYMKPVITPVM